MDAAELERLLRRWGRTFGERPPSEWDEESSGGSGMLTCLLIETMRSGVSQAGVEPFGEGRGWTAKGKASKGGPRVWQPNLESEAVELAWMDLHRCNREWAVILRVEYCRRGRRKEKIAMAAQYLFLARLSGQRYRVGLEHARDWIAGKEG